MTELSVITVGLSKYFSQPLYGQRSFSSWWRPKSRIADHSQDTISRIAIRNKRCRVEPYHNYCTTQIHIDTIKQGKHKNIRVETCQLDRQTSHKPPKTFFINPEFPNKYEQNAKTLISQQLYPTTESRCIKWLKPPPKKNVKQEIIYVPHV